MHFFKPILLLSIIILPACQSGQISHNVKPKQEPVYNFTQSSKVLSCLGQKIEKSDLTPIDVYISDIPDHTTTSIETGFLTKNSVMMVTTALDRLDTNRVAVIGKNGAMRDRRQVQILGSFTELNRTIQSRALSSEAIIPGGFELELGADRNANHIALDLAMSERNRIIPKTATSVSVQINGNSGDATITYDEGNDFAAIGAIGFSGQEGFHSGQRLLIETSVALMMSKYFQVDIRSCLSPNKKEKPSKIMTDYDEPIFRQKEDTSSSMTLKDTPLSKKTSFFERLATEGERAPNPRRIKPAMDKKPIQLNNPSDESFSVTEPVQLPENDGIVVLPTKSGPKYLTAQPREYVPQDNQAFSGIPEDNVPDPASRNKNEFLDQESSPKRSSYQKTF